MKDGYKPDGHQLTVRELIELLQKEDPDSLVYHEGCDCVGEASDITPMRAWTDGKNAICIGRLK